MCDETATISKRQRENADVELGREHDATVTTWI